ncbi:MAG: hypothetical protein HZB31_02830 [Nitrospirae bacterium]|nr:hypothetical protein [Nitrospirota bacterium]
MPLEDAVEIIRNHTLAHRGWRFLYTPADTFYNHNGLMFFGLNPKGGHEAIGIENISCENGNAFRVEFWNNGNYNPLQIQVCGLYLRIAQKMNINRDTLMDNSIAANMVPFYSDGWDDFNHEEQNLAMEFAAQFWPDLLMQVAPRVIICISPKPYDLSVQILTNNQYVMAEEICNPIGWGNDNYEVTYTMSHMTSENPKRQNVLLVRLPHLSRFPVMEREQSKDVIEAITKRIAKELMLP